MKTFLVMCVCAMLSACDADTQSATPEGLDSALVSLPGDYEFQQLFTTTPTCNGVLPDISALRLGRDGIAELDSDGTHLARWHYEPGRLVLAPVHAFGWMAAEIDLEQRSDGSYAANVDWWNASTIGSCTVKLVVRRTP